MTLPWPDMRTCLIISLRHLGDAVVLAGFVNAIRKQNSAVEIDVLGREQLREITELFCSIREYIPVEIPVFGHHRRDFLSLLRTARGLRSVRAQRYDCCINLMGDFRENVVGRFSNADQHVAPQWADGHLFRKHIRQVRIPGVLTNPIRISPDSPGYYASMDLFAQQLGLDGLSWNAPARCKADSDQVVVGIHPGASHPSKQWSAEKWNDVVLRLVGSGYRVRIFGAPSEAASLRSQFQREIELPAVDLIAEGFRSFIESLSTIDVLVGMDSFSAHAANALGIPEVVLHGPFEPSVMTPPLGVPLSSGDMCPFFPCYKGRACSNVASRYVCVRGIEVASVISTVEALIASRHSTPGRALRNRCNLGTN